MFWLMILCELQTLVCIANDKQIEEIICGARELFIDMIKQHTS